ncbi:SDR family NAD(P)-dependent oxidoreductase [Nocardia sp. NPDC088792]|uniref:SDR family NAD(P)-dependent oxidoreductase n=1 Tax=Nocardia sp. NPDC088792 TaxID=3364332 RepID=UPI0038044E98
MSLADKHAIIYGGAGAIGGAVAHAFAAAGATVHLAGRDKAALDKISAEIAAAGGKVHCGVIDALDETAVAENVEAIAAGVGHLDISFNAISVPQPGVQGIPLTQLTAAGFTDPVTTYTRANFITATAAARQMQKQGSGVILTVTADPARHGTPLMGGMPAAWSAIEALTRGLSAELGSSGVRAVGIRSQGIPETETIATVFGLHAQALGIGVQDFHAIIEQTSHLRRLPTLREVAATATFLASDAAAAITGTIVNLSAGSVSD